MLTLFYNNGIKMSRHCSQGLKIYEKNGIIREIRIRPRERHVLYRVKRIFRGVTEGVMMTGGYNRFSVLPGGAVHFEGITDKKIRTVMGGVLKKINMHALADFFRNTMDMFATGEFWGKVMRASCLIWSYTGDEELRKIIDTAAGDMMSLQREDGCISTCPDSVQPKGTNGSDLWERKYALMGLLYYHEVTGCERALECAHRLVRYTNAQVGKAPRKPITETGWAFCGIESSSILEPVMKVYRLTGDESALELGSYIVESGCCARENIFDAIAQGKSPKDIGWNGNPKATIAKAYEMTSCFEGLCEYYRVTGDDRYLELVKKYWDVVYDEEITILGSGGADAPYNLGPGTGEQWNFTRLEQTNPDIDLMMETCVTVYWMRLCMQLLMLTGEAKYADALEVSLYNAIYGALRPDGCFFEYFPRFNGARNPKVNYSFNIDGFDLSCCTANGPTALGMASQFAFMRTENGAVFNLYESGKYRCDFEGGYICFEVSTLYPRTGSVKIAVSEISGKLPEGFKLLLRVPGFTDSFCVNGSITGEAGSYLALDCAGTEKGSVYDIEMRYSPVKHKAPHGSNRAGDGFIAFTYGPLLMARDSRISDMKVFPDYGAEIDGWEISPSEFGGYLNMNLTYGGQQIILVDYMSAGNAWDGGTFDSWLKTK